MDVYELEVKKLLEEGGNKRLKSQFMNLSRRLDEVSIENKELKNQISELENKLTANGILSELKTAVPMKGVAPEFALKIAGYSEEDRIDKIEKVVLGIQSFLKKETEQKIKELEEEQERLMRETAYQRFISDLVRPLKP